MVKLLIAALNTWYQVPQDRLEIIMTSVFELQYTSLMYVKCAASSVASG